MSSLRDFHAVVAVAEDCHFGRAAERLGIAQSQLSEIIRRLEHKAQFKIFSRRPRVELTPAGEIYVETLRAVLDDLRTGTQSARAVAFGTAGLLRLGFAPVSLMSGVPAVLREFRQKHPLVDLRLIEGHSRRLCLGLERHEFDLVITREAPSTSEIESLAIIEESLMVAVPAAHRLSAAASVELSELAKEPFILFGRSAAPVYFDRIGNSCREHGFTPNVVQEVDGWSAILALVSADVGITIASGALSRVGFPGVKFLVLRPTLADAGFWLSWRRDGLAPATEQLRCALASALRKPSIEALVG
jgi:DNA-binding transcriptional LysR family regulator